ncbi:acetyltransferase [Legionella busanensis]|uniref:Acetyltransferase n=1 Tax=Legionella busanensis TaxID=190655 RepID=A0A378KB95_9GAMM|nr:GNAT family N-acetyltransferase [Legionella busanensis]STX81610.1 acetyltransferase [Legionella busanensis]
MIKTNRLIIRPPKQGDAKPLNEAINRSLAEISRWMPWASDPSLKTTEDFIEKGIQQWVKEDQTEFPMIIELKSNNRIISASGFNEKSQPDVPMFEIGYWIDSQYSGNGYITEAVNAITQYAFDRYRAVRVQICTQLDNNKSSSVAKRCGFIQEAILKNYRLDCVSKKPCDEVIWACFSIHQLSFLTPMTIE